MVKKLLWLNSEYIKTVSNDRLIEELKFFDLDLTNYSKKEEILNLAKQRANTLLELKKSILDIKNSPNEYEEAGVKKFVKDDTNSILKEYLELLEENKNSFVSPSELENITKPFIETKGLKFPQLFQPIRIALTGGNTSTISLRYTFYLRFR